MCDDTVRSTVSESVFTMFVIEQRVSWVEGVSDDSHCPFPTALTVNKVHGGKCGPINPFGRLYDPLECPPLCLCNGLLQTTGQKVTRSFQTEWYRRKDWLCGCATRNRLFYYITIGLIYL